jgi:hypothetical protein
MKLFNGDTRDINFCLVMCIGNCAGRECNGSDGLD